MAIVTNIIQYAANVRWTSTTISQNFTTNSPLTPFKKRCKSPKQNKGKRQSHRLNLSERERYRAKSSSSRKRLRKWLASWTIWISWSREVKWPKRTFLPPVTQRPQRRWPTRTFLPSVAELTQMKRHKRKFLPPVTQLLKAQRTVTPPINGKESGKLTGS